MSEKDATYKALGTLVKGAIGHMEGQVLQLPIVYGAIHGGRTDVAIKWAAMTSLVLAIANIFDMQEIPVGNGPVRGKWIDKVMEKMDELKLFEGAPEHVRGQMVSVLNLSTTHPEQAMAAIHYDDVQKLELEEGCGNKDCQVCNMLVRTKPPGGELHS